MDHVPIENPTGVERDRPLLVANLDVGSPPKPALNEIAAVLVAQPPPNFVLRFRWAHGSDVGYKDIDFESNPGFSKAFLLRGSDETRIRAVFDDEVLASFERTIGVSVEGDGDRLIYYRGGKLVEPANIRSFMDEGFKAYLLFRSRSSTEQAGGEGA